MGAEYRVVLGFLVASGLVLPSRLLTGANVWTIPGTVNAGGLNNTRFVSDLAVTNPGNAPAVLTISLVPANGTAPRQVTLTAGETVVYRNVLDRVWGAQGAGATQVTSDAALLIRARTYNTAASGTYGVALPVFADDRLLSAGEVGHSLWVSQSADGDVRLPDEHRRRLPGCRRRRGDGDRLRRGRQRDRVARTSRSTRPVSSSSASGSFAGAVAVARARAPGRHARPGRRLLGRRRQRHGRQLALHVRGPARRLAGRPRQRRRAGERARTTPSSGRTGASTTRPTRTRRSRSPFTRTRTPTRARVSRTFTSPRGRSVDVVDVLDSLLGLPVGSAGALRFRSDAPVGDPLPDEQRRSARASGPARSARSRSPRRCCPS